MRQAATVNLDRPEKDWKKVRILYKVIAFFPALFAGYISFHVSDNIILQILMAAAAFLVTYYSGLLGGIIGAWFLYVFQPKSIRLYGNPTTEDLFRVKVQWVVIYPVASILIGCLFPWLLFMWLAPEYFQLFPKQIVNLVANSNIK